MAAQKKAADDAALRSAERLRNAERRGLAQSKDLRQNQQRLINLGKAKAQIDGRLTVAQEQYNKAQARGDQQGQKLAKTRRDQLQSGKRVIEQREKQLQSEKQALKQALNAERKVLQDELKHQDGLRDRNAQRQAARLAEGAKGYVKASQARTREDGKRITAAENNANRQIYHERRLAKIQQQMAGVSTKLAKTKDATVKNAFQNTQKELAQSKRASTNASFSEG